MLTNLYTDTAQHNNNKNELKVLKTYGNVNKQSKFLLELNYDEQISLNNKGPYEPTERSKCGSANRMRRRRRLRTWTFRASFTDKNDNRLTILHKLAKILQ